MNGLEDRDVDGLVGDEKKEGVEQNPPDFFGEVVRLAKVEASGTSGTAILLKNPSTGEVRSWTLWHDKYACASLLTLGETVTIVSGWQDVLEQLPNGHWETNRRVVTVSCVVDWKVPSPDDTTTATDEGE